MVHSSFLTAMAFGYYRLRVKTYNYDSKCRRFIQVLAVTVQNGTVQDYTLIVQPGFKTITLNLKLFLEGFYMGGGVTATWP